METFNDKIKPVEILFNTVIPNHNLGDVHDYKGKLISLCSTLNNIWLSFENVLIKRHDCVSACCLLRVIADYLSTVNVIFNAPTEDDMRFRYYLYFLDGSSDREKKLKESLKKSSIKDFSGTTFNKIKQQVENAIISDTSIIQTCIEKLQTHPYRQLNEELFNYILNKKLWKYTKFEEGKRKVDKMSWTDMYGKIFKGSFTETFFSFISQYIHGMSYCASYNEDKTNEINSIYKLGTEVFFKYSKLLQGIFKSEIEEICKTKHL